jgi:hypothetical protein
MPGDDLAGFLVVEVHPLVADAPMCPGHQHLGPAAILAPTLLGLEFALSPCQHFCNLTQIAGIVDVAAVSQRGEVLQTHVQGRGGTIWRNWLRHPQQTREADVPLVSAAVDGHGLDRALERTAPAHFERSRQSPVNADRFAIAGLKHLGFTAYRLSAG